MVEREKYGDHLEDLQNQLLFPAWMQYNRMYSQSLEDPDKFWGEQAEKYLLWDKKWDFVLKYDFTEAKIEWFGNGQDQCLLQLPGSSHGDDIPIKPPITGKVTTRNETMTVTYKELYTQRSTGLHRC
jgi:acetyl-CoA synthetase